jgi:hypothetical protein
MKKILSLQISFPLEDLHSNNCNTDSNTKGPFNDRIPHKEKL